MKTLFFCTQIKILNMWRDKGGDLGPLFLPLYLSPVLRQGADRAVRLPGRGRCGQDRGIPEVYSMNIDRYLDLCRTIAVASVALLDVLICHIMG